jgi:hypothetical protein
MMIKFGVLDKLKVFKALVENQIGKTIKAIRCDGGGEYMSWMSIPWSLFI